MAPLCFTSIILVFRGSKSFCHFESHDEISQTRMGGLVWKNTFRRLAPKLLSKYDEIHHIGQPTTFLLPLGLKRSWTAIEYSSWMQVEFSSSLHHVTSCLITSRSSFHWFMKTIDNKPTRCLLVHGNNRKQSN